MPTEVQITIDGDQVTITVKGGEIDVQSGSSHGKHPHPPAGKVPRRPDLGHETPPVSGRGGNP